MQTLTREIRHIPLPTCGDEILGAGGLIEQNLPGYEPRQPQVELSNLIGATLEQGGHALCEAGTGTGKSFGYLIPAILKAIKDGSKVVISTDTIQLQEQLVRKDLPFLEKALGRPIRFAIAKGRSNWFCERNAAAFLQTLGAALPLLSGPIEEALRQFVSGEWEGDKSTLKLPVIDSTWLEMAADDTCEGGGCKLASRCAYRNAKTALEQADIIVTNHTMILLHYYILSKNGQGGILPEHSIWIADEAHTLSDKAQDVFGLEISQFKPVSFVKRVQRQANALGIDLGDIDLSEIERASLAFFQCFHGAAKDEQLLEEFPEAMLIAAEQRAEALIDLIKPVAVKLDRAIAATPTFEVERRWAISSLLEASRTLVRGIREFLKGGTKPCPKCDKPEDDFSEAEACGFCASTGRVPDANRVRYVEIEKGKRPGEKIAKLHDKPAETDGIFRFQILPNLTSAVFLSATLAAGPGANAFRPVAAELGLDLETTRTLQVDSPFDYPRQVTGFLSMRVPDSRDPRYHTCVAEEVARILGHTKGRAFVLFTSTRDMQRVHDLLVSQVRYPVLLQGTAPKEELVRQFKETPNAVLLGVKTFWTGVDIPGDALSCVIIVKLPFPAPSPLVDAKCKRIEDRGGSGFRDYSLPRCIRDFLQGFGRLIRTKTDIGLFVCLDVRVQNTRYGQSIIRALPTFPWVREIN